jgi:hypothetical protein
VKLSTAAGRSALVPIAVAIAFGAIIFAFPYLGYLATNGVLLLIAVRYLRAR